MRVALRSLVCVLLTMTMLLLVLPSPASCQEETKTGLMSLNVKGMAVPEVLKLIADEGGLNLAIGNSVSGNLTLFVNDMRVKDLLELVVDMAGIAYTIEGGVYQVMSKEDYETRYGQPYRKVTQARFFELRHTAVKDVLASLTTLRSQNGQLMGDPRSNGILAIESPGRLEEMAAVIETLDRPMETRAFTMQSVSPNEMAERLRTYMPSLAQVEPDPEGQRVLVTASPSTMQQVGTTVAMLDRAEKLESRPYQLTYAAADTISGAIKELLTDGVGRMLVDPRNHQLVITDFPSQFGIIERRISMLDVAVRQALIEARVISVTLNDEIKTGIDWSYVQDNLNVAASFPILADIQDGLRVAYSDGNFAAVVEALQTFGEAELLSSPRIMVADGQEAHILVGSQVPYTTIDTREGPNGIIDRFEKVTIVDVGVKLEVAVKIHLDSTVTIQVRPEVSSVVAFKEGIPVVETSESSSIVTVKNGRTIILGGLKKEEEKEERKGIPLLCRLPLLKYLFSSVVTTKVKSELAILLTPTIVDASANFTGLKNAKDLRRMMNTPEEQQE